MSDSQSALHGHFAVGTHHGAQARLLTIREIDFATLVQVQAWPDTLAVATDTVAGAAGVKPAAIGRSVDGGDTTIMTLAPGRWLIASGNADMGAALSQTVLPQMGSVTDLGHARLALQIAGAPSARMLNKHLPIDLDVSTFPAGQVAQSMIHHIDVTVLRRAADDFLILGFRGFGLSLFEAICDASLEFGYRLEKGNINP